MRSIFRKSLPMAALGLVIALTMGSANVQSYPKPTGLTAQITPEGHVVVSWHEDSAPVHRVGWAHDTDARAAYAAGDWLEAFHFADTKRRTDYTIKYLPADQKYWFRVGAAAERFASAEWSDEWTNLVTPSAGQPIAGPQPVQPPVALVSDRLVVVLDPPPLESPLDCEVTDSGVVNYRMSAEFLVDANRQTGDYEPMLATEWSLSPDGRTWNFKLRRGVRWHDHWGDFTARDVKHSLGYYTNPECRASYSDYFRSDPGVEVELVNDYEINVHVYKRPALDFIYWLSGYRGVPISSKTQWDQACPSGAADYGETSYGEPLGYCKASRDHVYENPARTGPYEFIDFDESLRIWEWQRVDYDHWRINPDFAMINIYGIANEDTRLAALRTGEAQIGAIGRSELRSAAVGGLSVVESSIPSVTVFVVFSGPHYGSEIAANRWGDMPWNMSGQAGRKVRMAMNKAIDRDAINADIFQGRGDRQWVAGLTPNLGVGYDAGYRPGWVNRWDELYGYDPETARQLLLEAGFPEGFVFPVPVFPLSGVPEIPEVMEAMAKFWTEIGLGPQLDPIEFSKNWRNEYRGLDTHCCVVYPFHNHAEPIDARVHFYFGAERFFRAYTSDDIRENKDKALHAVNEVDAAERWQAIADELFYQSATIPGWTLRANAVIDPDVVDEYVFLGPNNGNYIYLEYVKGVLDNNPMPTITYYVAASVDGYIADAEGGVDLASGRRPPRTTDIRSSTPVLKRW